MKSRPPRRRRRHRFSPPAPKSRSPSPRRRSWRAGAWPRGSCPSLAWIFFEQQPTAYQREIIGSAKVKVGVEAAVRQGWDALIGDGPFVGMTGFGASAPYQALYAHFGITAERVAEAALSRLAG